MENNQNEIEFRELLKKWLVKFQSPFCYDKLELLGESNCDKVLPSISGYNGQKIFYNLHGEDNRKILHFSSAKSELFCVCTDWFQFWHRISGEKVQTEWKDLPEFLKISKIKQFDILLKKQVEKHNTPREFIENDDAKNLQDAHKILFMDKNVTDNVILLFDSEYNRQTEKFTVHLEHIYPCVENGISVIKTQESNHLSKQQSYLKSLEEIDKQYNCDFSSRLFAFEQNIYKATVSFGKNSEKDTIDDFIKFYDEWKTNSK